MTLNGDAKLRSVSLHQRLAAFQPDRQQQEGRDRFAHGLRQPDLSAGGLASEPQKECQDQRREQIVEKQRFTVGLDGADQGGASAASGVSRTSMCSRPSRVEASTNNCRSARYSASNEPSRSPMICSA